MSLCVGGRVDQTGFLCYISGWKWGDFMETVRRIEPSEYILSVLSPQERLEVTLKIAQETFKGSPLRLEDIEAAVRRVRRKIYGTKKKTKGSR